MSGGSRHGIATAQGMRDINQNLQRNMAQTGYDTFSQDLDRKLQIAQQADQGNLARQQMMSDMLANQQNTMAGGIGMGQQLYGLGQEMFNLPWQNLQNYGAILGDPAVLSSGSGASNSKAMGGSYNKKG